MTNQDDMTIREAARRICANQAKKDNLDNWQMFLTGDYDQTPWMQIAWMGVISGIAIARGAYAD